MRAYVGLIAVLLGFMAETNAERSKVPAKAKTAKKRPDQKVTLIRSLDDALKAVYLSANVKALEVGPHQAIEKLSLALAEFYPKLSGNANMSRSFDRSKSRDRFLEREQRSLDRNHNSNGSVGLTLEQNLFAGGQTTARWQSAYANYQRAIKEFNEALNQLFLRVIKAYAAVLVAQKELSVRKNYEKKLQALLKETQGRYAAGVQSATDVESARARLVGATVDVARIQGQLADAETQLNNLTELNCAAQLSIPENFEHKIDALEEIIKNALACNNALLALRYEIAAGKSSITEARAGFMPSVSLQASAQRSLGRNNKQSYDDEGWSHPFYKMQAQHSANVGVNMNWTLPHGGVQAHYRSAVLELQKAQLHYAQKVREVENNCKLAFVNFQIAAQNIVSTKVGLDADAKALVAAQEEYRMGTMRFLDLVQVIESWSSSYVRYINASVSVIVQTSEVLALVGKLTPQHLGLNVPIYSPDQYYDRYYGSWFHLSPQAPKAISAPK